MIPCKIVHDITMMHLSDSEACTDTPHLLLLIVPSKFVVT